ncbi:MAG: general secretion pathway protein GspK [Verrucomicrobiota bacterium]|nr:general secretion pathway protein GspK [Verrucomicrobiota bacterium]
MKISRNSGRRSAALLLSLWALFLLSAVVIAWALDIDSRLTLNGNANRVMEAEAMAASGSEIAIAVKPGSPLLRGGVSRTQTFEARITGEGGRLNLNFAILNGVRNQAFTDVLEAYLALKGVELNDRERMVDCLVDWMDPDNITQLNGVEDEGDYHAPNRGKLLTIDELKQIKGWEEFTARRQWDADFTISPTTGKIDLAFASRDVLLSLPGMSENNVDAFLQRRSGPDGIEGTEDDARFENLGEALSALGLSGPQLALVQPYTTLQEAVLRVVSVGRSGDVSRTVQMVIRKANNGPPQLISWKEL